MTKPLSAAERAFVAGAIDGAIDLNDLSDETRTAMKAGGLSVATLGKIADTDTRIDTFEEVRKLYSTLEKFPSSRRAQLEQALLAEFRRHEVPPLEEEDALTLSPTDAARFGERHLDVPAVNQFSLDAEPKVANKMCYQAALAQLERFFSDGGKKVPSLAGKDGRIQVATSEVASGRVTVETTAAGLARAYIDACLDAGRPVLVGVSASSVASAQVNEGITEHFVTMCGKGVDEQGRAYYEFRDPGNLGDLGRFYVDPGTGKLFKPGKTAADGARFARDMQYEVSQVRKYRDMP